MTTIRFDDGAAYEDFMGVWSRKVGDVFVDWLAPAHGGRWLDVGCGNGAFTELLIERVGPSTVQGIDPSDGQIAYARTRLAGRPAQFQTGSATALPFPDADFDAAVMALVIFFVPDPALGVAEMARVVKPGGTVTTYAWDLTGGGFPYAALQEEMAAIGAPMAWPPQPEASRIEVMRELWTAAGMIDLDTREIVVEREYADFDTYWNAARNGPPARAIAGLAAPDLTQLMDRMRARVPAGADGRIVCSARAHAIKGRRPA